MKKITLTIVLITLAAMAVFASGNSEENSMPWEQGQGQTQYQSNAVISKDSTTVTGKVNLVENGHIELIVGSETYELVYPYRLSYAADLQDGMEITVEGFEAEGLRMDNDSATKNLVLKSATIDGETYDLTNVSNDFGTNGQRGNSQGGNRISSNKNTRGNQQGGFTQDGSFERGISRGRR